MVVGEANIHNIMGGMESTGGVRLHNHRRKLKQRFDIIKKLGQGTYGKVQLGINKETGQEVAIKTIKKCKIETEADLIRIQREIQIMSSVQHPNIIHIYEVFENREKMVLVMEYAAGGELYDYLSERKVLSEQEARRIFRQIATAVYYCHKHKICHRDLKLENILLDQIGNAKIADFGLSNVFDEHRLLRTSCGSPLYASPEIVKGTPYHGPEVDCWSLGVLLYTLVYGAMPFDGSNFKQLVKQISQSNYFEPKSPSPASPLIKDMLMVCPTERADIEKICAHWWVNEGYEKNCLDIAEDLAAQTPVRLDLLLSIVPQSTSAEKLLVPEQQTSGDVSNSIETLVPTRCRSVGSLMELDQNNSDRLIRELLEEEPKNTPVSDAKRKLETTPSMEETIAAGVKKKERSRRKERTDEKEPRAYRSTSRHHSAPIPNPIIEEAMDVDPIANVNVPTSKTVNVNQVEAAAACLELIEESRDKSTSDVINKSDEQVQEIIPTVKDTNEVNNDTEQNIVEETKSNESSKSIVPNKNNDGKIEQKKLKDKALSLDSELANETPIKVPTERRRSKIFETAEKFNQMASNNIESDKPKKILIPGVNVGGAKRAFERKASLSSINVLPTPVKAPSSKIIIDVPIADKSLDDKSKTENKIDFDEQAKKDEAKKRAVDIITGAIGKPPVQRRINGSPPTTPLTQDPKKIGLKIQVAPNDIRTATVTVSTPVDTEFPFESKPSPKEATISSSISNPIATSSIPQEEPKMSSKMEITLKSATLPRPRKTSKAEIMLSGIRSPEYPAFKSEVEAKIDAFQPTKLRTQRSEVAFPVAAAMPHSIRSSSLEPDLRNKSIPKERIIPIQIEAGRQHSSTPPPSSKPPMPQRSLSQRSGSLSRQSTADSDTDSALGSTLGAEPYRKSPKEYIIPISVEGGGYVTPRSGSLEPESQTSTPTSSNPPRTRFFRPKIMGSLLSDASEDESPFSTIHRDSEDLLQRHMHRLRSSRPSRQPPEHADSLSSGEDDDDDGFELLTAENLFSTLLSRVRSLTQRLNVDDNRGTGFPNSKLIERFGSNSSKAFWGMDKPWRTESQFNPYLWKAKHGSDTFGRKDSSSSINSETMNNSPGTHRTSSRENVFEIGSNTLPRDKIEHEEDIEAEKTAELIRREAQESLEQNFTPSLARRLSRHLVEQSRKSLPRSLSIPREKYYHSPTRENSESSDQTEYKDTNKIIRRSNSLLETGNNNRSLKHHRSPRRSISLFSDEDVRLPPPPRQIMTLGRKYKDPFYPYRTDKIQEESYDESTNNNNYKDHNELIDSIIDNGSISECTSLSMCNSNTEVLDTVSSVSARSYETSPTESSSNIIDCNKPYKSDTSRNFENRLLAAENLIKESKLKNLCPGKFNPNLNSNYKEFDKCDKEEILSSMTDAANILKRRSCIPSLRLRSASLTRDTETRCKSFSMAGSQTDLARAVTPERSILSKFFRTNKETESTKDKSQKPKQRRISRFLRPDFFDTPREESQYVKEKEAQKAAENERRKSRFMKKKSEKLAAQQTTKDKSTEGEKPDKELKNEMNCLKKDQPETSAEEETITSSSSFCDGKINSNDLKQQNVKMSFLQSLEKKLEKFRSNEETTKQTTINGNPSISPVDDDNKSRDLRECSAPPIDCQTELNIVKKAVSVEDLTTTVKKNNSKSSKVSSVLGLFRGNVDSKTHSNGTKSQNIILSKLKKSPSKSTKSDCSLIEETTSAPSSSGNSKIPMKSLQKTDSKFGNKKPLTETTKKTSSTKEKKKNSVNDEDKNTTSSDTSESMRKLSSSTGKSDTKSSEEKKLFKTKKNINTLSDKKLKTELDASKKRKIVRVVKKVVKKSSDGGNSSDSKSENKDKPTINKSVITPALKKSCKEKTPPDSTKPKISIKPANRTNLKLDLSKIPQHSFRNSSKKESPSRWPTSPSETKDQLPINTDIPTEETLIDRNTESTSNENMENNSENLGLEVNENDDFKLEQINHDELFSPVEETESFDSWSLCSADMIRGRNELHSPTSPSLFSPSGDQSESVIDRIRRRSFYSRFNDRKRASLNAPPPGITNSATLPRKFTFGSSRDKDRKLNNYRRHSERAYNNVYEDGNNYRRSPIDYEELTKSPNLEYSSRSRYLRSPTLELPGSRKKYHSTDFCSDTEIGSSSYRSPSCYSDYNEFSSPVTDTPRTSFPKKYTSNSDTKSIEYFEELLAPSNPDYLNTRIKSPLPGGENGYPNGNSSIDDSPTLSEKRISDNMTEFDQHLMRDTNQRLNEIQGIPSTSSAP